LGAGPSPKANPADVFQTVWYRLVLLFYAVYLIVIWFVLGLIVMFLAKGRERASDVLGDLRSGGMIEASVADRESSVVDVPDVSMKREE
jgi:heme/copper-type cytochrome/quinol oxidase subunit 2